MSGPCDLPRDDLIASGAALLKVDARLSDGAVTAELPRCEVIAGVTDGREVIFPAALYRAEQSIAERLRRLQNGLLPWPSIDAARTIA